MGKADRIISASRWMLARMSGTIGTIGIILAVWAGLGYGQVPEKATYNVVSIDAGFSAFKALSSSGSVPTRDCSMAGGNPSQPCAEKFSTQPSIDLALGIRPIRYLQGSFGFSFLGNFAGFGSTAEQYQCVSGCTGAFNRTIATHPVLMTIDARGVLPLFHERVAISGGAGLGWLQISQSPEKVGNEELQGCDVCQTRRTHGPTEVVEITYLPSPFLGVGFHFRELQVSSFGLTPITGSPAAGVRYKDHFASFGGSLTFRFGTRHH